MVREVEFLSVINTNQWNIHKIVALYTDNECDKAALFLEIIFQCRRSYTSLRKESKDSTWIYKVSLNTALVFRRKNIIKAAPHKDKEISQEYAYQQSGDPVNENLLRSALIQAIKSLGKTDRMIISLHLDGYSNKEIADMKGITGGNTAVKQLRIKDLHKSIIKVVK